MKVGRLFRERMIETLKNGIERNDIVFMISYDRLSGMQMSNLRKDLKKVGARLHISRNTIARRALTDVDHVPLSEKVEGQTAFIWSDADSVEVSKILTKFAKECEGVIVRGGILQGSSIAAEDVQKLADLPSREVLLATLMGVLKAPVTRLVNALNGKTRELLSILQQLSEKKGGS